MTDPALGTANGRPTLRLERRIAHPPERVWQALTDPTQLAAWFPFEVRVEPALGGTITFVDRGSGPDTTGEVTDYDPPRLFAYTWGGDHLRWEVVPDGDASMLVLVHTVDDRPGAASFAAGWAACLTALQESLDGATPSPAGDMVAAHEDLVARFGLDAGEVSRTDDGWRIRFERQLTAPATAAWDAIGVGAVGEALAGGAPEGGTVTAVSPGEWLEFGTGEGDGRIALDPGTGHGARLHVLRTGAAGDPDAVEQVWRAWVEALAARLARRPVGT